MSDTVSIELTKGKTSTIDAIDYDRVSKHSWYAQEPHPRYWQARTNIRGCKVLLHRFILNAPIGIEVDHINGDTLDNRRCNLRLADRRIQMANQRRRSDNTSGFKGVSLRSDTNKWAAYINEGGRRTCLGCFNRAWKAAKRYRREAIRRGYRIA